jgi:hypothetical protein
MNNGACSSQFSAGIDLSDATTELSSPREGVVTIIEDEVEPAPTGAFRMSASSYVVSEGGGSAQFTVERVNGASGAASVDYATVNTGSGDGYAVAGEDYENRGGTLSFADGQTQATFSVPILDDSQYTGDLIFGLGLANADTAIASPSDATVTIVDDESPPQDALELVWDAPTTNSDGSCLDDLAGFRVNYGLSSGDYGNAQTLSLDELTPTPTGRSTECGEVVAYAFPLDALDTASWYVTVQARDDSGNLSEHSEEIVVTVE